MRIRGEYKLEAELWLAGKDVGVVLAHPHPLFGGDMLFPLLGVIAKRAHDANMTALRFNFRGVGASEGHYSGGEGEVRDLEAALKYLDDMSITNVVPIGYSFGACIVMKWIAQNSATGRWIAIAPPINFMGHPSQKELSGEGFIICGTKDIYSPASRVGREYGKYSVVAINGADHFFSGFEEAVAEKVLEFLASGEENKDA